MDAAALEQVYEAFRGISRLFCASLWPQTVAGVEPLLFTGSAGAVSRAAQRGEPVRSGGVVATVTATISHGVSLGR